MKHSSLWSEQLRCWVSLRPTPSDNRWPDRGDKTQATRDGDTNTTFGSTDRSLLQLDCQFNDVGHRVEHRDFGEGISATVFTAVLLVGKAANRNPRVATFVAGGSAV